MNDDPVRGRRVTAVNALLLAWPFVPLVLAALLFGQYLPPWGSLLVVRLAVPWLLAGMLLGAAVLLSHPPDRLTRRSIGIPAVSIGLDAAWVWLCWVAGF